ncbi:MULTISPECIES: P-type conjugative transfer protein TrbG [Shewanella]|uniref:P-type conjugative transfer protein TrbG n=2 Tax=Shewanella TaxID=22 RepID=A9L6R8_SHEB9|nr:MULTISPECIES: P-type conjugative transfer protein TrbG [Shewanella]ABX51850.1 P-type conjugative transfer protein TrbG [Shewanella baltica OS195]MBW3533397.1 P-type conjugative transfer protein TrbG [Shewanella sp. NKUCC06_TVS]
MRYPLIITALLFYIPMAAAESFDDDYPVPSLSLKENSALALSDAWIEKSTQPITDGTGRVTYYFGDSLPSVVCSPIKTCVVELEDGEMIAQSGLQLGDSARWKVSMAVSGMGANKRTNLIIKPTDINLETTMTVATDRRVYQIKLISDAVKWMPFVAFTYPEQRQMEWEVYKAAMVHEIKQNTLSDGAYIPELDFNYQVNGKASFKPLRVYNDGVKTYVEMPSQVEQGSLPIILVVNGSQKELVNYRYQNSFAQDDGRKINGRFIIDQVSKELILTMGVGSDQVSILVKHKG